MADWGSGDIPDLTGKKAVVTGGNSGIGFETARQLALHGASVVVAARDAGRGSEAVDRILAEASDAKVVLGLLDLADLDSVAAFATAQLSTGVPVNILVNNAAVMGVPDRHESKQGFELQFATNHLGHFALTGRLLPSMRQVAGSRVVTVSSLNHRAGTIHFDDLQLSEGYTPYTAYNQSKLSNAMFTLELDRRLRAAGSDTLSVGAHPGYTHTRLQFVGPRLDRPTFRASVLGVLTRIGGQDASMGALPTLYAAAASDVSGGEYFGPRGIGETRGRPVRVSYSVRAHDAETAQRLWQVSEELTGVRFDLAPS